MTTTIHTLPARGISASITNRNPRLRQHGTKFVLFDHKPNFYCSVYTGEDIINAIGVDIVLTGFRDKPAEYPAPANVKGLKTVLGNLAHAHGSWFAYIVTPHVPAVLERATAIARDILPLLYESTVPAPVETELTAP
jgi:hypothetical protein